MKANKRMFVRRNLAQHHHYSVMSPTLPSMDVDPKGDKFYIFLAEEIATLGGDITINHMGTLYATCSPLVLDGSLRLRRKNVDGQMVYTTLLKDTLVAVPAHWANTLREAGIPDINIDRWVRIKTKHPLVKYSK